MKNHVNASGYPLQIAIENSVNANTQRTSFKVLYREHAWKSLDESSSGFADLVLSNHAETIVMVVECKRVKDTAWIFMAEGESAKQYDRTKAFLFNHCGETYRRFEWLDLNMPPATAESAYCVIPGSDGKSKTLIERAAAELVEATESIASEERSLYPKDREIMRIYVPVIVTTAKLQLCLYRPEHLSLADGVLSDAIFEEVPYVRFRKQVSTSYKVPAVYSTFGSNEVQLAKQNTIFVVNAEHLDGFLSNIDISHNMNNRNHIRC